MGGNAEVIKSLEAKMADCQKRFNEVETNIANIIDQSKKLQNEYDQQSIIREQIRGEYTGYMNLLNEIKKVTGESQVVIPATEEKPVKTENKENKDTLTADEVTKLKEITKKTSEKKTPAKKVEKKKEDELPDYLKPENQPKK